MRGGKAICEDNVEKEDTDEGLVEIECKGN